MRHLLEFNTGVDPAVTARKIIALALPFPAEFLGFSSSKNAAAFDVTGGDATGSGPYGNQLAIMSALPDTVRASNFGEALALPDDLQQLPAAQQALAALTKAGPGGVPIAAYAGGGVLIFALLAVALVKLTGKKKRPA